MNRYLILSLIMTVLGLLLAYSLTKKTLLTDRKLQLTLLALLILTAIFDSLIIAAQIVDYNPEFILNIYIGKAPIEDFMYTIVVVPLSVALWRFYGKEK